MHKYAAAYHKRYNARNIKRRGGIFFAVFNKVIHKTRCKTYKHFKNKGFGGGIGVTVENIIKAHTDRACKTALPAAYEQRRQNHYKVAEMYVHIRKRNKQHRKRNIAKRREKRYHSYVYNLLVFCLFHFEPFFKKVFAYQIDWCYYYSSKVYTVK